MRKSVVKHVKVAETLSLKICFSLLIVVVSENNSREKEKCKYNIESVLAKVLISYANT